MYLTDVSNNGLRMSDQVLAITPFAYNQENGKYIAEIGENAAGTRIVNAVLTPILNAPLN